jgi:hypothetical protein
LALGLGLMAGNEGDALPGWFLLLGAPLAALTALVVGSLAAHRARRRLHQMLVPTASPFEDVARLERRRPRDEIAQWLESLEVASYAWPLVGIALMAPLLLHLVAYFAVDPMHAELARFRSWIVLSVVIAAFPHITFVSLAVRHAQRLARGEGYSGWAAVGWITASSLFPWVVLLGVPSLITFVTAMVLVPASFLVMQRVAERERAALRRA